VPRSLRTANAELEEEEEVEELAELVVVLDERPVVEAPVEPDPLVPVLEELAAVEALVVPAAETFSPTSPESVTIVPFVGA
jgi:hypothetical protein